MTGVCYVVPESGSAVDLVLQMLASGHQTVARVLGWRSLPISGAR